MKEKESFLHIQNVSKVFSTGFWLKPKTVLQEISFTVPKQCIFGLLGANGSGKTTLLSILTGLRKPNTGFVHLTGIPTYSCPAKKKIGFLPERPYFYPHLTGEQFLKYCGTLSGLSKKAIQDSIPIILETVKMPHARKTELNQYSKGMLQRIGIAQALLHNPELLILDEPMSGLDPNGRKEIHELLIHLSTSGKTILFTSHEISHIKTLCQEIVFLESGTIKAAGKLSDFLSNASFLEKNLYHLL